VRSQQFLLSRIDARNGAFGLVPDFLDRSVVNNDFPSFNLDTSRIIPDFLDWMCKTNAFVDLCRAASEGTTNRVRLKIYRFLAMNIPLPPLDEQRRIVARIEELAAKIYEAQKHRRHAVEEAETLLSSYSRSIFASLGHLQPLGKITTIRGGGTPSKANPFFWVGQIPWISPKDIKIREISDSTDHISEEATTNSSAKLLPSDSVLIVVRGMILAHTVPSAILRVPAAINQDMKALIPHRNISPEYLCTTLWALNPEILNLVEKSSHDTRRLQTPKLLDLKIPLPPLDEQRRIVAHLDELQAKVDALKKYQAKISEELNALLPSVLDKAFKGEL